MKTGFVIKNTKTGKYYTGKAVFVNNPNFQKDTWDYRGHTTSFGGIAFNMNSWTFHHGPPEPGKLKPVTEKEKEMYPQFYRHNSWAGHLEEYVTPLGSDGTNAPPWMERVACYWGDEPKVISNEKAAKKILSIVTGTYYKDRDNPTTALLYLPNIVHDFKIVQVKVNIIEVDDGPGIATDKDKPE